jgi:hypothetical protein
VTYIYKIQTIRIGNPERQQRMATVKAKIEQKGQQAKKPVDAHQIK